MKVTRKTSKIVYIPLLIELETDRELKKMMDILNPHIDTTLHDYCKANGLNFTELEDWKNALWNELYDTKEDC